MEGEIWLPLELRKLRSEAVLYWLSDKEKQTPARKEFVYIVKKDRGNQEKASQICSECLDKIGDYPNPWGR